MECQIDMPDRMSMGWIECHGGDHSKQSNFYTVQKFIPEFRPWGHDQVPHHFRLSTRFPWLSMALVAEPPHHALSTDGFSERTKAPFFPGIVHAIASFDFDSHPAFCWSLLVADGTCYDHRSVGCERGVVRLINGLVLGKKYHWWVILPCELWETNHEFWNHAGFLQKISAKKSWFLRTTGTTIRFLQLVELRPQVLRPFYPRFGNPHKPWCWVIFSYITGWSLGLVDKYTSTMGCIWLA